MTLDDLPLWFTRSCVVVFGLLWGSFLNVVIYRVPKELSIVRPGSHCGSCGKPIRGYDNIPILSWLILRGRARCCGARISVRYPLVELLGGGLSLAIFEVIVRGLPAGTPLLHSAAVYAADLALVLGLVAAAFIDAEYMYLPDSITLGGTVLGLATTTLRGMAWTESLFGAAIGFVGVWLPFVDLYRRVRGQAGMGLGDAKLTMLAGAWFGWAGVVFVVATGAVQGTLGALVLYLVHGKIEEPEAVRADREELRRAADAGDAEAARLLVEDPLGEPQGEGFGQARLPFGPFLILACIEFLLAGDWILQTTRSWLSASD
jgi:leader peptidase (prepilin peptidase) / N-methyltransferase